MPRSVVRLAPRGRSWRVTAVYGPIAWYWWWTRRRLVLLARCVGRWRSPADALDALKRTAREVSAMPAMPDPGAVRPTPHADPGGWKAKYPLLVSYMVDPVWPSGEARKPAKLFLSIANGSWVWTLKEPSLGYILTATVDDPAEGLAALESQLKLPSPPWMVDPWDQPRKGRRK